MKNQPKNEFLTKKSENISGWYNQVVLKAELADYGPAKGTMVIRPYGFAIWERVQEIFNKMIKSDGVENAYFPLFIPHSLLEKEKTHVEGFSPELAIVTHGGGKKLKEPLVVRPTSETIMYEMYAKWIQSWRDLPVQINQWNNVVRWELRTYLFLRTTEFLWQEGHTAHETEEENIKMALKALDWYRQIYEDYYAIPVIIGTKSEAERFAGAKTTYTIEALMPDGKALQGATSHNLGQNFSKVFNISFQDRNGKSAFVWQTSWGLSTRSLGGLFLSHGDDNGLILPPKVAPIKAVIIPILGKDDSAVLDFCQEIKLAIEKVASDFPGKVETWSVENKNFGSKIFTAELKGIPIIIKVGPKELASRTVTVSTRFSNQSANDQLNKRDTSIKEIGEIVEELLVTVQQHLFNESKRALESKTHVVDSYEDFKSIMKTKKGFLKAHWCGNKVCEAKIKEETKASTRVLPLNAEVDKGKCIYCAKPSSHRWYFAQAY